VIGRVGFEPTAHRVLSPIGLPIAYRPVRHFDRLTASLLSVLATNCRLCRESDFSRQNDIGLKSIRCCDLHSESGSLPPFCRDRNGATKWWSAEGDSADRRVALRSCNRPRRLLAFAAGFSKSRATAAASPIWLLISRSHFGWRAEAAIVYGSSLSGLWWPKSIAASRISPNPARRRKWGALQASDPGWTRTTDCLLVRQLLLPLSHGTKCGD
jgi:hypothetical protein